ncbi:polyadenylate-binding protein-interacting protein 1 isoform X2 [Anopheles moucheti]|uniref:polyadenylate-binding protein-interacting protein 1 isoform X2 n=1 Tax=Anopheles moucheti TaxID=186751 RepID=UPI0022F0C9DD|nr:polyadenylate-binding protein-interacting protein 1 isoform X2 [Anopheles moucheti]
MAQQENYPSLRSPNFISKLSVHAKEFVPHKPHEPYEKYCADQYPKPRPPSDVSQRLVMAQVGVEQGGGDGSGGGGGGYDHRLISVHPGGTSNQSSLPNQLSNMQIGDNTGDNGNEQQQHHHHQHHHHHNQQSMHHQHHQQHRGQQHPGGGHHGYHHHQQQQQPYGYEVGYPNNHYAQQVAAGGMVSDHRKYNNAGQQHHQPYQHHRSRQQHHHHHQQPHQQRQQHQQQQQQYGGNHHSDYVDPRWPANYTVVPTYWDSNAQEAPEQISYRQTEVMDYLTEVIAELLDNPGMFDEVQKQLPAKLGELRQDNFVLSSTIEMIFEQSIRESNFRYMGARMCQLLDSLDCGPDISVRRLLQLKMEDQNCELQQFMSKEQVKVRGATLFLAELYMQLRKPQDPFDKIVSEHIISAIEILLSKEGPENIKCVCQCLKLCGYELEQDCREKLESILKKLQSLTAIQSSSEAMIKSVIELRKNSWGRSEEIAPAAVAPGPEYQHEPVFYGPDGKMLTEEESSFLATGGQNPSSYDDDDEFGMDDDLEVQEAFEEFLQQSNVQNRLQQPAARYRPDA